MTGFSSDLQVASCTLDVFFRNLHNKRRYVCLCVSSRIAMARRTAGPIKTKLGIGTHVDPGSVLVKVKVMWCYLVNANKTPDRGPQGRDNRTRSAINFRPEDGYLQPVVYIIGA